MHNSIDDTLVLTFWGIGIVIDNVTQEQSTLLLLLITFNNHWLTEHITIDIAIAKFVALNIDFYIAIVLILSLTEELYYCSCLMDTCFIIFDAHSTWQI